MIPYKLFMRMTDMEEEFLQNKTAENFKKSTSFQDEIGWPFKASQEQIEYWENFNHD